VVEKRHVGDEIQLLPCLVVRFEPGLEGTMIKKNMVGEGEKRKELRPCLVKIISTPDYSRLLGSK
jgi:hypothetical protein